MKCQTLVAQVVIALTFSVHYTRCFCSLELLRNVTIKCIFCGTEREPYEFRPEQYISLTDRHSSL